MTKIVVNVENRLRHFVEPIGELLEHMHGLEPNLNAQKQQVIAEFNQCVKVDDRELWLDFTGFVLPHFVKEVLSSVKKGYLYDQAEQLRELSSTMQSELVNLGVQYPM